MIKLLYWAERGGEFIGFIEANDRIEANKIAKYYKSRIVGHAFSTSIKENI